MENQKFKVQTETGEIKIRVVDYKTGSKAFKNNIVDINEIFSQKMIGEKHSDYYLQTMLYSLMVHNSDKWNKDGLPVIPALLFIQHTAGEKYDPTLCINKEKISDIKEPLLFRFPYICFVTRLTFQG